MTGELQNSNLELSGRIRELRKLGGVSFFSIRTVSGRIPCFIARSDECFAESNPLLQLGNMVQCRGFWDDTRNGTKAFHCFSVKLLAACELIPSEPSLRTPDSSCRDICFSDDVFEVARSHSLLILQARTALLEGGYKEFLSPPLSRRFNGGLCQPFQTSCRALDGESLYLRVSSENYLRQFIAAGFESVYEIGYQFRNEGRDAMHLPQFMMLEAYTTLGDSNGFCDFILKLIASCAGMPSGAESFQRISVTEILDELRVTPSPLALPDILAQWALKRKATACVTGLPVELSPLYRRTVSDPHVADRYWVYLEGLDVADIGAASTDPSFVASALSEQSKHPRFDTSLKRDNSLLQSSKAGLPPVYGCGISLSRLQMINNNQNDIRMTEIFPL